MAEVRAESQTSRTTRTRRKQDHPPTLPTPHHDAHQHFRRPPRRAFPTGRLRQGRLGKPASRGGPPPAHPDVDGWLPGCGGPGRGALQSGHVQVKGEAIGKAVRIVDEGLKCALDLQRGGALAADLDALYQYIVERLTQANATNSDATLEECADLLRPIRDAWSAITPPRASNMAS